MLQHFKTYFWNCIFKKLHLSMTGRREHLHINKLWSTKDWNSTPGAAAKQQITTDSLKSIIQYLDQPKKYITQSQLSVINDTVSIIVNDAKDAAKAHALQSTQQQQQRLPPDVSQTPVEWITSLPSYTVSHKKRGTLLLSTPSPIIDRYSKFFHWHTLQTICNNVFIIYPSTL